MEKVMKALVVQQESESPKLTITDVNTPIPASGQVLIKVHVTPVHYCDVETVKSTNLARFSSSVPGLEGSGVIVQENKSMLSLKKVGKKVSFMQLDSAMSGAWAEYIVCDSKYFSVIGDDIDFLRASTLMVNPLMVLMMNEKIKKNQHKVVIHSSANSALSILFLRWCHFSNIICITVVKTAEEYEKLKSASPEYALIQENAGFAEELKGLCLNLKPTCAFDANGGEITGEIFNLLANEGEMFLYGGHCDQSISKINPSEFIFGLKKLGGLQFKAWFDELSKIKRYKYYKQIQDIHFLFNPTEISVYPITEYEEALGKFSSTTTTLLHFASGAEVPPSDILSQYIPSCLKGKIGLLPALSLEVLDFPVKILDEGIYKGDFCEGKIHGKGVLLSEGPACIYLGEFVNGKKQGFGRLVTESFFYEGDWEMDTYQGKGKHSSFDGYVLEGEFVKGKIYGIGSEVLANGERYEGEFAEGLRHGHGIIKYQGVSFTGGFRYGVAEGSGKLEFDDGKVFVGQYVKGVGTGEMTQTDGTVVPGVFTNGVFTATVIPIA